MKTPAERDLILRGGSRTIGMQWVRYWCKAMQRDGRPVAGGWPGTLPEARARVAAYFMVALPRRGMLALSHDELMRATRCAYDEAKREWQSVQLTGEPRSRLRSKTRGTP